MSQTLHFEKPEEVDKYYLNLGFSGLFLVLFCLFVCVFCQRLLQRAFLYLFSLHRENIFG